MAIQSGSIRFTGKLDNVIGYYRNGKYCLRSSPQKVQQTAATKQAARNFGIASRKGKLIRQAIVPHLDIRCSGSLVNRMNQALLQTSTNRQPAAQQMPQARAHGLQTLTGFRFNPTTGIDKFFAEPPIFITNNILQIPAQALTRPQNATHLEVRMLAIRINFAGRCVTGMEEDITLIDLQQPFTGIRFPITTSGKGALCIVLQVRACNKLPEGIHPSGNARYIAADIIAMIPPSTQKQKKNKPTAVIHRHIPHHTVPSPPQPCIKSTSSPSHLRSTLPVPWAFLYPPCR